MEILHLHDFIAAIDIDLQRQGKLSQENFITCRVDSIPEAIYRDICQQLLKISNFSQNNSKPVMIGQELKYKQQTWSMIAVVTIDHPKKKLLYRYLITDGLGKIPVIIAWYNDDENSKNGSFDFSSSQYFAQAHSYSYNNLTYPQTPYELEDLSQNAAKIKRNHPLIVPYDDQKYPYPPIILHQLAKKIKKGHDLTAWAYNVENINYPQKFQVIYPNSLDSAKKFDKILYGHHHRKSNKIIAIFLQTNQKVTQIINNIYQALVIPVTYPRCFLIGIFLVGAIIIVPTLIFMLFYSFNVGLVWLGCFVVFFMGLAIGLILD